jgi:hypothetical protein
MHRLLSTFLALACFAHPALGARPMITDDARIVDAKACQVESWVRFNRDSRELWALPSCTPVNNLELTVGGGAEKADDGNRTTDVVIQGKTLFKPLETNGYGAGLVLGTVRHPAINTGSNQLGDVYAYVPASLSLASDRVILHANLGALRSSEDRRNHATWGLSSEIQVTPRVHAIAEAFGPATGTSYVQLGFRHWLVPDRLQMDATWGERLHEGSSERWYTLGLRFLTPAFLP